MTSTLPKKFEAFAVPGGLKGQLADLSVPEILQQLGALGATGILTLVAGGARKALYVKDGKIVFASSNLPNDRLGEIMVNSFHDVLSLATQHKVNMRTAAYMLAISRVANVHRLRGIYA